MDQQRTIEDAVADLARARRKEDQVHREYDAIMDQLQSDQRVIAATQAKKTAEAETERLQDEVRMMANIIWRQTKQTKPHEAVTIKMMPVNEIIAPKSELISWCRDNFTPAIDVDLKMLLGTAKSGAIPEYLVRVTYEARAYIASDLSKWG